MAKNRVMGEVPKRPELKKEDIAVGKFYRGKYPKRLLNGKINDREVIWISEARTQLQYDGPSVPNGAHYPRVSMTDFLKWASHEVY